VDGISEPRTIKPESIVETNQHGHLVLECMQLLDMEAGDHVSVDDLAEYAFGKGVGLDELENAILHASSNGWIHTANDQVSQSADTSSATRRTTTLKRSFCRIDATAVREPGCG
jgi:septum formation inhibitor-activating ATPase MinD